MVRLSLGRNGKITIFLIAETVIFLPPPSFPLAVGLFQLPIRDKLADKMRQSGDRREFFIKKRSLPTQCRIHFWLNVVP